MPESSTDLSSANLRPGIALPVGDHSDPMAVRLQTVEKAAEDLRADFQRQHGELSQSQVDRLVLRRNLSPAEMVAVIAKLRASGIVIHDPTSKPPVRETAPPSNQDHDKLSKKKENGVARTKRSPYALLTPNEEAELGRQIQLALRVEPNLDVSRVQPGEAREIINRGLRARDRLTVANLRLINFAIRHIARSAKSLDPWDLYQEGTIGLMRAVEKFDPELGLKFSTYALWWIRQAIFRGLDDKDRTIRVPVHRLASIR